MARFSFHQQLLLPLPIANININHCTQMTKCRVWVKTVLSSFKTKQTKTTTKTTINQVQQQKIKPNKQNQRKLFWKDCLHRGNQKWHHISEEISQVVRWEASQSPVIRNSNQACLATEADCRRESHQRMEGLMGDICATSQQRFPCSGLVIYPTENSCGRFVRSR